VPEVRQVRLLPVGQGVRVKWFPDAKGVRKSRERDTEVAGGVVGSRAGEGRRQGGGRGLSSMRPLIK
jgi:hypothetical protein